MPLKKINLQDLNRAKCQGKYGCILLALQQFLLINSGENPHLQQLACEILRYQTYLIYLPETSKAVFMQMYRQYVLDKIQEYFSSEYSFNFSNEEKKKILGLIKKFVCEDFVFLETTQARQDFITRMVADLVYTSFFDNDTAHSYFEEMLKFNQSFIDKYSSEFSIDAITKLKGDVEIFTKSIFDKNITFMFKGKNKALNAKFRYIFIVFIILLSLLFIAAAFYSGPIFPDSFDFELILVPIFALFIFSAYLWEGIFGLKNLITFGYNLYYYGATKKEIYTPISIAKKYLEPINKKLLELIQVVLVSKQESTELCPSKPRSLVGLQDLGREQPLFQPPIKKAILKPELQQLRNPLVFQRIVGPNIIWHQGDMRYEFNDEIYHEHIMRLNSRRHLNQFIYWNAASIIEQFTKYSMTMELFDVFNIEANKHVIVGPENQQGFVWEQNCFVLKQLKTGFSHYRLHFEQSIVATHGQGVLWFPTRFINIK